MNNEIGSIEEKLLQIVNNVKQTNISTDQLDLELEIFGITSIEFIRIVVECEMLWNIEFEAEKLYKSYFKNLSGMSEYILTQTLCNK